MGTQQFYRVAGDDRLYGTTNTSINPFTAKEEAQLRKTDSFNPANIRNVTREQLNAIGTGILDDGSRRYNYFEIDTGNGPTSLKRTQIADYLGREPLGRLPTRAEELAGNTAGLTSGSALNGRNPFMGQGNVSNQMGAVLGATTGPNGTQGLGQTNQTSNANGLAGQYQALLGLSPEEQQAQQALDNQETAFRNGMQNVSEQPIGMQFISGQQASLENRNTNLQIPLQQKLALAQQKRQASLDAVKFQLDRSDKEQARKDDLAQQKIENSRLDTQVINDDNGNARLINKQTGEVVKDLGGGSLDITNKAAVKAFQQANGLVADGIVGPKTLAKMGEKGITSKGKTGSGTPTPAQQKKLLTNTLNTGVAPNGQKIGNGRGADGYVDPSVYLQAFKEWTGTPSGFLAAFPVKTNVNPQSYALLPAALKPTSSSSRGA